MVSYNHRRVSLLFILHVHLVSLSTVPWRLGQVLEVDSTGELFLAHFENKEFNYNPVSPRGPHNWTNVFPDYCSVFYEVQSPIAVNIDNVSYGRPYSITYSNSGIMNGRLWNNGHAPEFLINENSKKVLFGFLPGIRNTYTLDSFHLHFGKHPLIGSEHSLHSKHYSGEIHLVHGENLSGVEASRQEKGTLVVAILFKVSYNKKKKSELDTFIHQYAANIIYPNNTAEAAIKLSAILPRSEQFYTYTGSKTTPDCGRFVKWIVMKKSICINYMSWVILSKLLDLKHEPISKFGNHRPIQQPMKTNLIIEANFRKDEEYVLS